MRKNIIILLIIIFVVGLFYWRGLNSSANPRGQEQLFVVAKGETVGQIAENLRRESLIKSIFYFKYVIWRGHLNIKAGEYLISSASSAKEIIKILTSGEVLSQEKSIRIIEGWNLQDIGDYLEENKIVSARNFLSLTGAQLANWKFSFPKQDFLNDAFGQASLEGYLFPDTYRIYKTATAEEVVAKMLANFDKKLTPAMREEIKRQKKTIYEIVTMASLIEKEVRTEEDMKIVSGIFWDRIKNGEPLQSCATLAYILGIDKKQYSLEDTKASSPYNTYRYRGLPPGPIANPGLRAIKAAIYPRATQYNYFLSDLATGQTIYSKTLEEHNRNKEKYLQ
jgi:UPF0755 protein